ncbi:hypothetical protein KSP39_PZI020576 [Platanthera zijinensis]|uniref:Uncharacterized protein n=1 Tax=Platanthera zijinensis TaxID=2320716 RepID=A0AAP0B0Y2_9ASPA
MSGGLFISFYFIFIIGCGCCIFRRHTCNEDPGKVAAGSPRQSALVGPDPARLVQEPGQRGGAILIGGRKAVLRREAVVGRDDDTSRGSGEMGEEAVVAPPCRRADAEAASVEVEDDGKLGLELRHVDTGPETGGVVDGDVYGGDGRVDRVAGRDFRHGRKALHSAVFVESYEAGDLFDDFADDCAAAVGDGCE